MIARGNDAIRHVSAAALVVLTLRCRRDGLADAGAVQRQAESGPAGAQEAPGAVWSDGASDAVATVYGGPAADGAPALDGASSLAPIAPAPIFTNLAIPGYPEAVVSVPNGATTRRPVLLVLHGSGDRPDWNCDAWRHITGARGFVLCPRGAYDPRESTPGDTRYTHPAGPSLGRHVDLGLEAIAARFGPYVDTATPVLAGFSLGAAEVARLSIGDPSRFPRVALLEGGHMVWTDATARTYSARGGRRVLFGCGSPWCTPLAKTAAALLERHGIEAQVVYAPVGHTNDRPLQEAIMREIDWFLADDPRWDITP